MFRRKKKTTLQRLADAADHVGKAKEELQEISKELLQQGPDAFEAVKVVSNIELELAHLQGQVEGVHRYAREQRLSK